MINVRHLVPLAALAIALMGAALARRTIIDEWAQRQGAAAAEAQIGHA